MSLMKETVVQRVSLLGGESDVISKKREEYKEHIISLETAKTEPTSLGALLCSRLPFAQPISILTSNPVVIHSIKIWNQIRRSFSLKDLLQAALIIKNDMFAPSMMDEAFAAWARKGVIPL